MQTLLQYLDVLVFVGLLGVGYLVGRGREKRHFASIREREKHYAGKVLTFASRYPPAMHLAQDCVLVSGCVVIGSDYFKRFVAGLRTLFGGRVRSYESLLDRARREAILRMKADAERHGCAMIFNVKFESTNVTSGGRQGGMPAVEAFAYGTALRPRSAEQRGDAL